MDAMHCPSAQTKNFVLLRECLFWTCLKSHSESRRHTSVDTGDFSVRRARMPGLARWNLVTEPPAHLWNQKNVIKMVIRLIGNDDCTSYWILLLNGVGLQRSSKKQRREFERTLWTRWIPVCKDAWIAFKIFSSIQSRDWSHRYMLRFCGGRQTE